MSGAMDSMSAEDTALLDQMRADDAGRPPEPPPQSEPESQPEAVEAEAPVEPAKERPPLNVPQQALDKERTRRQQVEKELAEFRTKAAADTARLEGRFQLIQEALAQQQPQPQQQTEALPEVGPAPDMATDPAGYMRWQSGLIERLGKQVETLESRQRGVQQQTEQERQMGELAQWGRASEQQFHQQQPDYGEAVNHLRTARVAQLNIMGIRDPVMQHNAIQQDVNAMAAVARQQGLSLGQMIYELAKNVGYVPREARTAAPAAPPAVEPQPAPQAPTDAQRLATMQRGQQIATTVGSSGTAPQVAASPQQIANMSDEAFEEMLGKINKMKGGRNAALRQVFGG